LTVVSASLWIRAGIEELETFLINAMTHGRNVIRFASVLSSGEMALYCGPGSKMLVTGKVMAEGF
jgi:hypothetical protein